MNISNTPLPPYAEQFLRVCRLENLAQGTMKDIRGAIVILQRNFPDLLNISSEGLLAFFEKGKLHGVVGKPWSPSRQNNIRKYLDKFYKWCVQEGLITKNPILSIPRAKMAQSLPKRISEEEKMKLLYHVQNFDHASSFLRARNHTMVMMLLTTGLRIEEMLVLQNSDLSLEEWRITVRRGKGNKERQVFFGSELRICLKDYIKKRDQIGKESPYIFPSFGSNGRIAYTNFRRMLLKVCAKAGIKITAHQLRHTCFSKMVEQGIDLETVREQAGHTSILTTQRYIKVSDQHRRSKVAQVVYV